MIKNGLLEEAKSVFKYKNLNALNTVGYKELFNYFEEQWTLDFAISEIKKNTRRFAKRQLTWFQKDKNAKWFEYDTPRKYSKLFKQRVKKNQLIAGFFLLRIDD